MLYISCIIEQEARCASRLTVALRTYRKGSVQRMSDEPTFQSRTGSSRGVYKRNGEIIAVTHKVMPKSYAGNAEAAMGAMSRCAQCPETIKGVQRVRYPVVYGLPSSFISTTRRDPRASCTSCASRTTHTPPSVCVHSTQKDSFKDPNMRQQLLPYHPNALRSRVPVHFKNEAKPFQRFCQVRNEHTYECVHRTHTHA